MLSRRRFLVGACGSLASLLALSRKLGFGKDNAPMWKHESTLNYSKFVIRDSKVRLYTVDEDHICACWELPSCKLVRKTEVPFPQGGRPSETISLVREFPESPYRATFAGVFTLAQFQPDADSVLCLLDLEQGRWHKLSPVTGRTPVVAMVDAGMIAYRVPDEEGKGRFVIQLTVLKDGKLVPDRRCHLPLQVALPIYWDYRWGNLRLLYLGLSEKLVQELKPRLQGRQLFDMDFKEYSQTLKPIQVSEKLYLAHFDVRADQLKESRLLYPAEDIVIVPAAKEGGFSMSPAAYNLYEKKLYVLGYPNSLVLSEEKLSVEREIPIKIEISENNQQGKKVPLRGFMSIVDGTGQYLALDPALFGRICVVNLATRKLVLDDGTHLNRVERKFSDVAFPLGMLRALVHDMVFIPETTLLAVITGTGDLYLYNVQTAKLERVVSLARSSLH